MPVAIRAIVRIAFGLLGLYWFFLGIFGVAYAGSDHEWGATAYCAMMTLIGIGLAYAAFVRAPWERKAKTGERAA